MIIYDSLGDVRDKEITTSFNDTDIIVHAAALKQVVAAEYNPIESINTNINGAENIIHQLIKTRKSYQRIRLSINHTCNKALF